MWVCRYPLDHLFCICLVLLCASWANRIIINFIPFSPLPTRLIWFYFIYLNVLRIFYCCLVVLIFFVCYLKDRNFIVHKCPFVHCSSYTLVLHVKIRKDITCVLGDLQVQFSWIRYGAPECLHSLNPIIYESFLILYFLFSIFWTCFKIMDFVNTLLKAVLFCG